MEHLVRPECHREKMEGQVDCQTGEPTKGVDGLSDGGEREVWAFGGDVGGRGDEEVECECEEEEAVPAQLGRWW